MKIKLTHFLAFLSINTLLLFSACGVLPALEGRTVQFLQLPTAVNQPAQQPQTEATAAAPVPTLPAITGSNASALAALQGTLENIYARVNPSVVNIQVISRVASEQPQGFQLPFDFQSPSDNQGQESIYQTRQSLGSGFVWDNQGHIVTNNHVVEGADKISVTLADGSLLNAHVVGTDPDADLAVIKVDGSSSLQPLSIADSGQVKVGQLAVAIGNPFGLEGTMTVGFISALGRSLPVNSESSSSGATYTIPDVIQTDAPINPGNSGGVLVNDQGNVVGVTTAIETNGSNNSGIGFVVPSNIVQKVVPELIKNGKFEHVWLGISGTTLTPQISQEMNLADNQRGILVVNVSKNSPADKAGLKGSDRQVSLDDGNALVGGDVITAVNGQPLTRFDDLVSYLFNQGAVGQELKLDALRDGKPVALTVKLEARPSTAEPVQTAAQRSPDNSDRAHLGIQGMDLNARINKQMNLNENQTGVLVVQVQAGSPAEKAGLKGSTQTVEIQGQQILIGGDVIIGIDHKTVTTMQDLKDEINKAQPESIVQLTILRDGKEMNLEAKLVETSNK